MTAAVGGTATRTLASNTAIRGANVADALRAVLRTGLAGSIEPADPIAVGEREWPTLLSRVRGESLTGLALAAVRAGRVSVTDDQWADLVGAHRRAVEWVIVLERKLATVSEAFAEARIPFVVLKGAALAHSVYPSSSWRTYGDVDVLVRGADWPRACAVLAGLGIARSVPELRPGFDVRFGKGATHAGEDGVEVDLHRLLTSGPFGLWLRPQLVFDATADLRLGARTLTRLDDVGLFLHACAHAVLGNRPPRLLALRDVAQTAPGAMAEPDLLQGRVRAWRLAGVVERALEAASAAVGFPVETPPLPQASRAERLALLAYTTPWRERGGITLASLVAIPGTLGKAVYVRDLLLARPDARIALVGEEGRSPLAWWRRPLRWLAPGWRVAA